MRHPSSTYAYCRARTESDFVVHRVTKAPAFPTFVILRVLARLVAEALITNPASAALRLRALLVDAPSSTDGTLAISCRVCSSAYSAVAVSRERYASNCLPHATEVRRSRSGPRRPDRRGLNRSPAAATCSREGRRNQGGPLGRHGQ